MRFTSFLTSTALVGAAALGAASPAQAAGFAYGGGSSLIATYWRTAADCFGERTSLKFRGPPASEITDTPDFFYVGAPGVPAFDCAAQIVTPDSTIDYISTGSGTGIKAFFSHDPNQIGDTQVAAGTQLYPTINYGISETSIGAAEVAIYNNGGTNSTVGVTVVAPGVTPGAGQYQNPKQSYGALVQFPLLVAPVAIAFDPVYKKVRQADGSIKEYSFHLNYARADGSGGLHLNTDVMCKIFNGQITNWNDPAIKSLNAGKSLKDPTDPSTFSVPLQIVGRQDSSGTTSLFTRYISNICDGKAGNSYANATSRIPGTYTDASGAPQSTTIATGGSDLAGVVYLKASATNAAPAGETLGAFTLADGNDGVAKYVDFSLEPAAAAGSTLLQGRIGYMGADYALPYAVNTGTNTYDLITADLMNASGYYRAPTPYAADRAFRDLAPPQSDASGGYSAGTGTKLRANPQDWVEAANKSSPLANPANYLAYPIVGTANILLYTCYRTSTNRATLSNFIQWYLRAGTVTDATNGILAKAGYAGLPNQWRNAIRQTFFSNDTGLNLAIVTRGQAGYCPASMPGG